MIQMHNPSPIFLMGPTATGKTALALEFAKYFPVEIISVDSALIYRGMDIGTGKPSSSELSQVPHHLIDICDPAESYSAENFRQQALQCIADIHARNKIPLLVGGTLLYFSTLLQGLSQLPSANPSIRDRLLKEAEAAGGWQLLHNRLNEIDPKAALRIHPNDSQRIQRALEVYEITGKPLSTLLTITSSEQIASISKTIFSENTLPSPIIFQLTTDTRADLHQRIETRFHQMLKQGFVEEVKTLFERGDLDLNKPAIRAVGYRQCWRYLQGEYGYEEMVEKAIAATRQLAKRQLTGLRALTQKLNVSVLNSASLLNSNHIKSNNSIKSESTEHLSSAAYGVGNSPDPDTLAKPQFPYSNQNFSKNFFQLSANDHSASLKFMLHSVTQSGNY